MNKFCNFKLEQNGFPDQYFIWKLASLERVYNNVVFSRHASLKCYHGNMEGMQWQYPYWQPGCPRWTCREHAKKGSYVVGRTCFCLSTLESRTNLYILGSLVVLETEPLGCLCSPGGSVPSFCRRLEKQTPDGSRRLYQGCELWFTECTSYVIFFPIQKWILHIWHWFVGNYNKIAFYSFRKCPLCRMSLRVCYDMLDKIYDCSGHYTFC